MTCIRTGVSTIHPRKDTHATGAFDIHVLLPLSTNPPSTSSATVSIPAGSEPWFGSVKPCNAHSHGSEYPLLARRCRPGSRKGPTKQPTSSPFAV